MLQEDVNRIYHNTDTILIHGQSMYEGTIINSTSSSQLIHDTNTAIIQFCEKTLKRHHLPLFRKLCHFGLFIPFPMWCQGDQTFLRTKQLLWVLLSLYSQDPPWSKQKHARVWVHCCILTIFIFPFIPVFKQIMESKPWPIILPVCTSSHIQGSHLTTVAGREYSCFNSPLCAFSQSVESMWGPFSYKYWLHVGRVLGLLHQT